MVHISKTSLLHSFIIIFLFLFLCFTAYLGNAGEFIETQNNQPLVKAMLLKNKMAQIEIDWPKKVKLSHVQVGNRFIVSFSQSLDVNPKRILEELSDFIETMDVQGESRVLIFTLKKNIALDIQAEDKKTLFYFLPEGKTSPIARKEPPKFIQPPIKQRAKISMKVQQYEAYDRILIGWKAEGINFDTTFKEDVFEITFNSPATLENLDSLEFPLQRVEKFTLVSESPFKLRFYLKQHVEILPIKDSNALRLDFILPGAKQSLDEGNEIIPSKQSEPFFSPLENEILTIDIGEPLPLYAFQRGPFFYIGFPYDFKNLEGVLSARKELLALIKKIPVKDGTLLQLKIEPTRKIKLERQDTAWNIIFNAKKMTPSKEGNSEKLKKLIVKTYDTPKKILALLVENVDSDILLEFKDPILKDVLKVLPLSAPGQHIDASYDFVDFQLLKTLQGVVLKSRRDGLLTEFIEDGLLIKKDATSSLLRLPQKDMNQTLSSVKNRPQSQDAKNILDFINWRGGSYGQFKEIEESFFQQLVHADQLQRNKVRLDLARFYLSYAMGSDALAVLNFLGKETPGINERDEFRLLYGVASFFNRDYETSFESFQVPSLVSHPEILFWQALYEEDLTKARGPIENSLEIIESYPYPIHGKIAEKALSKLIQLERFDLIELVLNGLESNSFTKAQTDPAITYYRGILAYQANKFDASRVYLENIANQRDRYYSVRAKLQLIKMDLELDKMTTEEAIHKLQSLQYAWRGDYFERDVLMMQIHVNLSAQHYRKALSSMKQTITLFPEHRDTARLAAHMNELYQKIFLSPLSNQLSAIESYALFKRFIELLPTAEKGNKIVSVVAEKLIGIELFDKGAEMLDYQVEYRLEGQQKSEVGARLAAVYLLDNTPQKALDALNKTIISNVSESLSTKRQLLRARALLEMKAYDASAELIAPYTELDASLLKVDIAWAQKQWMKAARLLETLIAQTETNQINPAVEDYILKLSVALSNADDPLALRRLQSLFASYMAKGQKKQLFDLITRSDFNPNRIDIANIKTQVSEIDLFEQVLQTYKQGKE